MKLYCFRKGANGVSANGVAAKVMFFDRGTFWVLPSAYFHLPRRASGASLEQLRARVRGLMTIYIYIYISLSLYIYIYICACTYTQSICIYIYIYMYECLCVLYIYIYIHLSLYIYISLSLSLSLSLYIYIYIYKNPDKTRIRPLHSCAYHNFILSYTVSITALVHAIIHHPVRQQLQGEIPKLQKQGFGGQDSR